MVYAKQRKRRIKIEPTWHEAKSHPSDQEQLDEYSQMDKSQRRRMPIARPPYELYVVDDEHGIIFLTSPSKVQWDTAFRQGRGRYYEGRCFVRSSSFLGVVTYLQKKWVPPLPH